MIENKLGITSSPALAREEERIMRQVIDWSKVDKDDYLLAMERSPIKDIEIKHILKNALTNDTNNRELYTKGIDHSYYYEGYYSYSAENLSKLPEIEPKDATAAPDRPKPKEPEKDL